MGKLKLIEPVTAEEKEALDEMEKTLNRAIIFPADYPSIVLMEYSDLICSESDALHRFENGAWDVVMKHLDHLAALIPAKDKDAAEEITRELDNALSQFGNARGLAYAAIVRTMQDPGFLDRLRALE